MFAKNNDPISHIISNGLCTRCGSCIGLSEGNIRFQNKENSYLPKLSGSLNNKVKTKIEQACSGKYVPFPDIVRFVFGDSAQAHTYLGVTNGIFIGYATDPEIRQRCASAGVLSSLLIHLLETDRISGAVVLGMDPSRPWMTKPYIAKTREAILQAAQSKYIISSINEILPQIKTFKGSLSYTGLPCQVHSIRKLQMINAEETAPITYIIGPFCGNTLHFSSIVSLLKSYGIRDYRDITHLSFREGEWPGNTYIRMSSGREIILPKFHANYLIPFHIMKRCLLCIDLCNEFTDISVGDAWAPVYEERKKGFSLIISRTPRGLQLLKECAQKRLIHITPLSINEAIQMHSHGYDLKKRGSFIRMNFLSKLKKETPEYGFVLSGFPFRRYGMELIIDSIFYMAGKEISIRMLEHINPTWMGCIFTYLRTFWKKITHNIKRNRLIATDKSEKRKERS